MDCDACTDHLIDLLDGILDETEEGQIEVHLQSCDQCRSTHLRMSQGLQLARLMSDEPAPASVMANIMAAAEEKADRNQLSRGRGESAAPLAPTTPASPTPSGPEVTDGFWGRLLHWVGDLAMGPQVAMTMMLFLVVGMGLWYLPELKRQDPLGEQALIDPSAGNEVGPSAGIEPAQPLALNVDQRRGRVRVAVADESPRNSTTEAEPATGPVHSPVELEGEASAQQDPAFEAEVAEPTGLGAEQSPIAPLAEQSDDESQVATASRSVTQAQGTSGEGGEASSDLPLNAPALDLSDGYSGTRRPPAAAGEVAPPRLSRALAFATESLMAEESEEVAPAPPRPTQRPAPAQIPARAPRAAPLAPRPTPRPAVTASVPIARTPSVRSGTNRRQVIRPPARGRPAVESATATEGAMARAESDELRTGGGAAASANFQAGMRSYRERNYRVAISQLSAFLRASNTADQIPTALHHLARSHRAMGQCATALRSYEGLLRRHRTYRHAGRAMLEAGECYRRLGQLERARRWWEQAATRSEVAAEAQRALSSLEPSRPRESEPAMMDSTY